MTLEDEYKEDIRQKRNKFISDIMKCYLDIVYQKNKVRHSSYTKYLDKRMLGTLVKETNKFTKEFE